MLSLIQRSNDPFFNLATEDFLLHERKEDFLLISINEPSVVVGKHQVTNREVNTRITEEMGIPVIRRISGGGTVYHDRGNLNFAFIRNSEKGRQVDFPYYIKPVTGFLNSLGIGAVFGGKNDITVNGLKISGNAEHVFRDRVLHHGTLLFDASLEMMRKVLKPASDNYSTRGVESNRTSVTNLKGMPGIPDSIDRLASMLHDHIAGEFAALEPFSLSSAETESITELSGSKYKSWDWNWGYGPAYTFTSAFSSSGRNYRCRFKVRDGIIWESDIEGNPDIAAAAKKLIGLRHLHSDIYKILGKADLHITPDDIYNML